MKIINPTGWSELKDIYDPLLIEAISPTYPQWRKYCVKRKYGKYPAQYIDMLYTHERPLFDYIPKVKWRPEGTNFNVVIL